MLEPPPWHAPKYTPHSTLLNLEFQCSFLIYGKTRHDEIVNPENRPETDDNPGILGPITGLMKTRFTA
ncbi:hypothetical protein M8J75_011722 [Diaphorina citri]|nr:hypothetical protein M8J75_011722 [Diaphorina citri]